MIKSHPWINEIKEDDPVRGLYLAKVKRMGLTRKGDPFLSITLADRTGVIEARVWERAEELSSLFSEGDILDVEGYACSYRDQIQFILSSLKASKDGADPTLFLETTTRDVTEMMSSLRAILKETKDSYLKALVDSFLSDQHFTSLFKNAPAAKNFHHSYIGGLLEHTLSVCQMTKAVAEHYPELDSELLLTAAFLHDIGKVRELKFDYHIDYTDEGRLLGHITLGVAMVDEKLAGVKNFPQELALRLKHLILSHHGQYEFGSPKRPKFLEAFALHLIDDMDAKMNGLGRFMVKDRHKGAWTEFNRLFERYFLKGKISIVEEKTDHPPGVDEKQNLLFEVPDR
ncbi:MAG: CRISPR-associated endonuclease Cas3'' [Deltaproteobacteria bacterium]|nr:CRISPR-associated endonuclease Cas3'' [Deltaproteobacteria bacterium]